MKTKNITITAVAFLALSVFVIPVSQFDLVFMKFSKIIHNLLQVPRGDISYV